MSFHHIYYNIFLGGSGTLVGEFTLLWDGEEVSLGSWRGVMVGWGRGFPRELEGSDGGMGKRFPSGAGGE